MHLMDLIAELEVDVPVVNIVSPLRLLSIGKYLDLDAGRKVIDFGCGRGEMLCLWARSFGIEGIGVDLGERLLEDGRERASRWHIEDRVRFICQDAKTYEMTSTSYDVAACIGATMAFGGYRPTIQYLKNAAAPGGSIAVGEPFYTSNDVPEELRAYEGNYHTETELFQIAREEGLEVGYYSRATLDEWDRYIFNSRRQEMRALIDMTDGPEREKRRHDLRRWQDMYLEYRQRWQRIAFMTLHRV